MTVRPLQRPSEAASRRFHARFCTIRSPAKKMVVLSVVLSQVLPKKMTSDHPQHKTHLQLWSQREFPSTAQRKVVSI
ncbi:hypothetical protein Ae201684P_019892 [Aphanomyces euteiches]|uniref:Uncharacterized protein n=1 Tax=Aphanomyces euteiches TaxID=100861 RepID=A0A6G0WCH3_9STRA|nr:hypothetical protein Ae201684_017201 [Aphanomyces euteiches]KAH9078822.1 hypothetical protein Ae201684P_019892 [Aphanomyces euteiches]